MTSYKKMAEDVSRELEEATARIEAMNAQIEEMQNMLLGQAESHLSSDEAKQVLRTFGSRAKSKEEMLLLLSALTKL